MENMRTKGGNADFGINKWPVSQYGEFYQGTYLGVRLHLRVREVYCIVCIRNDEVNLQCKFEFSVRMLPVFG